MAQNPALTQLLTMLNAAPHPNMGMDFFAHVGSHMALARTIPPAWFPIQQLRVAAQGGSGGGGGGHASSLCPELASAGGRSLARSAVHPGSLVNHHRAARMHSIDYVL